MYTLRKIFRTAPLRGYFYLELIVHYRNHKIIDYVKLCFKISLELLTIFFFWSFSFIYTFIVLALILITN